MNVKENVMLLVIAQGLLVVLFCVFATYKKNESSEKYGMFQDVHVMIFIGVGFLMTFLKRYGYSSLGFTLLLGSFMIQWAMLCQGFFDIRDDYKIELGIESMYKADVASASVLISLGAILGRTTITQLLVMGVIEIALYCTNLYLGSRIFQVTDAGGSIFVHVFAAYFGLAVSYVINKRKNGESESGDSLQESTYTSDLFAMIGTIFLWLYWPSFNAIDVVGDQQHRAVLNTYLALASCCITSFACSLLSNPDHKFDMVHVQNSTLAGGVAIGAVAHLEVTPGGAMIVGMLAGGVSVYGYTKLTPMLEKFPGIPDTCGIHNLHGLPAVLSAIVSALMAGLASRDTYEVELYQIFPARMPEIGSLVEPRTAANQAGFQLLALAVTLLVAIVGGLATGRIMILETWQPLDKFFFYDDNTSWNLPRDKIFNPPPLLIFQPYKKKPLKLNHTENACTERNCLPCFGDYMSQSVICYIKSDTGYLLNTLKLSRVPRPFYYNDALSWITTETSKAPEKKESGTTIHDNPCFVMPIRDSTPNSS